MPELPEVEITRRGIAPHLQGREVTAVVIRQPRLRWPVPPQLPAQVTGRVVCDVTRRGKYLLIGFAHGALIVHLGMSGSLRVEMPTAPAGKHDHFDLCTRETVLRLHDPRRFGALLWSEAPLQHPLLAHLGIEPLASDFTGAWLHAALRTRTQAIKPALMDHTLIAGIGNIYASEALFRAGLRPTTAARRLSGRACDRLVTCIGETLREAIAAGGSSLRDFVGSDGHAGHFQQRHFVYGRAGEPCRMCATPVRRIVQGQRASFYCPHCQRAR